MKTGDKVRFIHSKGEGIIKKVIDDKTLEVEIEDGFIVPVLKNEIVVVAKEESSRFQPFSANSDPVKPVLKDKNHGVFLAVSAFNDRIYSLNLVNNTGVQLLYAIGEKSEQSFEGIGSGTLRPGTFEKIKDLKIADFENWPEFTAQLLLFKQGRSDYFSPVEKSIKFKASSFFKSKKYNALLDKEVFLYQLDQSTHVVKPEEAKSFFTQGTVSADKIELTTPNNEVDLHIEVINPSYKNLPGSEILNFQINYFEKQMENAIASGMKEITFIHGTGNGTLKNSIHKKLADNMFIKYFEDARKEKFGYGATFVKLK